MKFSDIILGAAEMELIEQEIDEYEQRVYGGNMPAHVKQTLRAKLVREEKEGIWSNRDYVYGQDEGEPYRGDVKN